jgi:hypothetical protein
MRRFLPLGKQSRFAVLGSGGHDARNQAHVWKTERKGSDRNGIRTTGPWGATWRGVFRERGISLLEELGEARGDRALVFFPFEHSLRIGLRWRSVDAGFQFKKRRGANHCELELRTAVFAGLSIFCQGNRREN